VAAQRVVNATATGSPTVAVIGDSYTSGNGATDVRHGWAYLLARREGWRPVLLGIGGTGLRNDGPCNGQQYLTRVAAAAAVDPAGVIVEGGLNDRLASAADEENAIHGVVTELRAQIPGARIALIGPPAPGPSYVVGVARISRAFRAAAEVTGVQLIDPYAAKWFTPANRPGYIAPDGIHPNDAGHAYFAERVAEALGNWP
jgi:lysophospholipase L1-like esterase